MIRDVARGRGSAGAKAGDRQHRPDRGPRCAARPRSVWLPPPAGSGAWQHLQAPLTSDVRLGLHLTQPPDIRRIPLARFAYECGLACSLRTSSATASPVPVGALQDRHLVPQRKDLHILVAVAHRQQAYERERVRQGEIGQSQHGRSSSPKGSGPAVRVSSWKVPLAQAAGTIRPLTYADELSAPAGCLAWSASSGTRTLTP